VTSKSWADLVTKHWHPKGIGWRRLAYLGSRYGPTPWLKHSPGWFGVPFALALRQEREAVRQNLRRLFGPRPALVEERDILRTFVAYAHCLAESLGCERDDAKVPSCLVQRQQVLDALLRSGTGFIVGTAHTGGWDIAAQCLMAQSGRQVVLVMDREPDDRARALQDSLRGKRGLEIVHVGADALEGLALLRQLKQGGVVAVQLDRMLGHSRGVEVQLGRQPFRVPLGPFVLASLAQVPLVPLFVARRGYYQYLVRVHEAICLPRRLSSGDAEEAAQRVAGQLEAFLLDYPEQWFNFDLPAAELGVPNVP
jgi:phosphatidylinositol dimannoside acyltransferase